MWHKEQLRRSSGGRGGMTNHRRDCVFHFKPTVSVVLQTDSQPSTETVMNRFLNLAPPSHCEWLNGVSASRDNITQAGRRSDTEI